MIIDAHVHFGRMIGFNMDKEIVLESAKKYNIDYMLVSSTYSTEADHEQNILPEENQISQLNSWKETIEFSNEHPNLIGAVLWAKPHLEKITREHEKFIEDNIDIIHGIKIHPYHSVVRFDDERVIEYVKLAGKYSLPVLTHTAPDECSDPKHVYTVAKMFPDVNFVMGHMELGTDNSRAIEMIKELPNLYGDTAWVMPDRTVYAISQCGPEKILFGTDNPIDGVDTYANKEMCSVYLNGFKDMVSEEVYDMVMCENAKRIYKVTI